MKGKFFNEQHTHYSALYVGYDEECNQKGTAVLSIQANNTLSFWILPMNDSVLVECPDESIHIMPTTPETAVILTKQ